jgi:hypothetical protein
MLTDVQARHAVRGRRLRYSVLAPVGTWIGCGRLRVLRAAADADDESGNAVTLTLGYESYQKYGS